MSKVLVIPDIHLKPVIFDRAEKILESGQADFAVQLGDMFDDWGEEFNYSLYDRTVKRAIDFHEKFPKTLWCMGNHDFGYYLPEYGRRETGHSRMQEDTMADNLAEMVEAGIEQKIIHVVDNVIFSHAGLTGEIMFSDKMQVVGHTPVETISFVDNVLSTDVFSTYRNGAPFGERKFAIVDTEKMTWQYAEEDEL